MKEFDCLWRLGNKWRLVSDPVLANAVPTGDDWQHEIKFDGFRVQIHKLKVCHYRRRDRGQRRRWHPRLLAAIPAHSEASRTACMGVRSPGTKSQGSQEVVAGSPSGAPADLCEPVRQPGAVAFRSVR